MTKRKDNISRGRQANWPPPRVHPNPLPIVQAAMTRARTLVGIVRQEGSDTVGEFLDRLTPDDLYALTTVLACMVPDDRTQADLLSWVKQPARPRTLEAV